MFVIAHIFRQASLQALQCCFLGSACFSTQHAPLPEWVLPQHSFPVMGSFIMPVVLQSADLTVGKLTTSLRMPHAPPRQAADAIKHLLHLQAEGARSARNLNPVKLYLEAQVSDAKQSNNQHIPLSYI